MTETKRNLIELAGELRRTLDNTSNKLVGTQWWNDRVNELARMERQIEGMK